MTKQLAIAAAVTVLTSASPAAGPPAPNFFTYTVPGVVKSPGLNAPTSSRTS